MAVSGLRLLVVEGNVAAARERAIASGGTAAGLSYADLLRRLAPDATVDICYPADPGSNLPGVADLAAYDGVAITGSALNIYDGGPAIEPQVALVRDAFQAGTPMFGSCWGLQVATVAAGGTVRANPKGREIGIARRIVPTAAGRDHPLLAGRPAAYDAICVHLDEVETMPAGMTVLAGNAVSDVQAAEIRHGNGVFWGVQYHPEYTFREIAAVMRRYGPVMVTGGFVHDAAELQAVIAQYDALDAAPGDTALAWRLGVDGEVLDPAARNREIGNWLAHLVRPARAVSGKAETALFKNP
ncbi:glutamine amidotransferase [Zavarzinia compransoris]|uniref:Glutamine amidotransferase n=1 Tax=Zavarzinia compransoris TaxID=1264899 RepID=A0A317E5V1_9PROT|nr:glutamine amidotransferase [Zavarzinia compransoris]